MSVTHILPRLQINTGLAHKILMLFLRDAVTKIGFERAVIALSGGIDSALSAFLVAEALGPDNVLGIRMPYKTSSPDSLADAQAVVDALGIRCDTVEITPMVDPLLARFPDMSRLRQGNIMARTRMVVLYDQSAAFNGLVIGTSNKTETLLGYTTIYGDNAAAVQPITDLYKAQVRQLARALGVPSQIIDKPPSADLWIGQTDEDELGFSYDVADQLLFLLVDERYTVEEAVAEGFDRAFVERIWQQVRLNHYKRTMPNVAKLSNRSVGHDFLYLRDWGG
ncbi:MAG: NAD+ synthase [Anaerolineae bacterium]|jgi:NAD+ synthase|nr:NAD+ synthase [Anaerolineae bacterium]